VFGGTVIDFDGAGDYLSVPASPDFDFGEENFTISLWAYFETTPGDGDVLISNFGDTTGYYIAVLSGNIQWRTRSSGWFNTGASIATGEWMHIAAVRSGDTLSFYINGVFADSTGCTGIAFDSDAAGLVLGRKSATIDTKYFDGYMDAIVITRGEATWTTDFDPPNDPDVVSVDRFTDMGDGTVRDNESGLIWLKDANAFGPMNWDDAMNAAATLSTGEAGLSDGSIDGEWRLPYGMIEWDTLMEPGLYVNPPQLYNTAGDGQWVEGDPFTGVQPSWYWSSMESYPPDLEAWYADMVTGYCQDTYKEYLYFVWPVRDARVDRFTDMGDGTIRDNESGLIWLKDANAFGRMHWPDAMNEAAYLSSGEHGLSDGSLDGDWRLPTKEEWSAFMSNVYDTPALVNTVGNAQWSQGDAFIDVQSQAVPVYVHYWSSTEYEFDLTRSWYANINEGYVSSGGVKLGYNWYVWPVRSGN